MMLILGLKRQFAHRVRCLSTPHRTQPATQQRRPKVGGAGGDWHWSPNKFLILSGWYVYSDPSATGCHPSWCGLSAYEAPPAFMTRQRKVTRATLRLVQSFALCPFLLVCFWVTSNDRNRFNGHDWPCATSVQAQGDERTALSPGLSFNRMMATHRVSNLGNRHQFNFTHCFCHLKYAL